MQESTFACGCCHRPHPVVDCFTFDDSELCEACYENETAVCYNCGERVWREDMESDGYISLCQTCFDRYYTHCTDCGRLLHYDAANYPDDGEEIPIAMPAMTVFGVPGI